MSVIFGLVHLDGRPVAPDALERTDAALASWGPDGAGAWTDGAAALGHRLLAVTPEALHERMPLAGDGLALVAAARLDNRDELLDELGVPGPERPTTPDGRLVLLAYHRWGEGSVRRLYGDWSFAAWDPQRRRLVLARDQLGNTGLFYCHRPGFVAFSSAASTLPGVARQLNEGYLARYLAISGRAEDETIWNGVSRVQPGHLVTVDPRGLRVREHWSLEDVPPIRFGSDDAYAEAFLDRYRRAVRSRLRARGPVASTLSAGLDSGSVTALAAEALRERGERLLALTSVPLHRAEHLVRGSLADEWPLAHAVAEHCGSVEHVPVRAEGVSPIAGLDRSLAAELDPQHAAVNLFWLMALLEEARRRGARVLLTGQLGNGGISWSGGRARTLYLFGRGKWRAGMRALRSRSAQSSWPRAVQSELLAPLVGPLWRERGRLLRGRTPFERHGALTPALARRLDDQDQGPRVPWPFSPEVERRLTLFRNGVLAGPTWHAFGSSFGLEVRDPTADARLLELCAGVPDEQHVLGGKPRALVRRAMAGLMPDAVRESQRRGKQAADVALRLRDHRDEVELALARLGASTRASEYLDVSALRASWRAIESALDPDVAAWDTGRLLRGLMAGRFLERAFDPYGDHPVA